MFRSLDDASGIDPARMGERLAAVIDRVGDEAAADAGLEEGTIERIRAGDPGVDLGDAATVLALDRGSDAGSLVAEAREELLIGMSTAVLDVETLAGDLGIDRDPKELQAMLEGRLDMTVEEYGYLRSAILGD